MLAVTEDARARDRQGTGKGPATPKSSLRLTRVDPPEPSGTGRPEALIPPVCSAFPAIMGLPLASPKTGEVAERLNAPVSKTGMGGFVHRGFESLPLR